MKRIFVILVIVNLANPSLFAFSGYVNTSSELYSFESEDKTQNQFYQKLQSRINFYQQNDKKITFSTYGRWRSDTESSSIITPKLSVYNLQMDLKGFVKSTKLSVGRQFVYSAVGSALLDGLSLKSTLMPNSELSINVGSEVKRLSSEKIQKLSDNLIVVSRYQYIITQQTKIGLNWFLKKDKNQVTINRVGLDMYKKIKAYTLYTRVSYNISLLNLSELLLRTSYRNDKWYLSVESRYREPLVNSNSLFAIISSEKYKRIRFDTQYKLNKKTRVHSQIRYAVYDDDNSYSGSIGISRNIFSLFYNFQVGRGTENNGFSGTIRHQFNNTTSIYGTANVSRYKIQEDYKELSEAYSTAFGGVKTFSNAWKIQTKIQVLRNAVESSNVRVYAKLSKRFSI